MPTNQKLVFTGEEETEILKKNTKSLDWAQENLDRIKETAAKQADMFDEFIVTKIEINLATGVASYQALVKMKESLEEEKLDD